ncbi:hypothetical protein L7F22_028114 [Adiantum nelumboides]|nr:hypothetical protein [Adiantum nelumboides]
MMLTANLPKNFWEEAVATAYYLQNRTPHSIDPKGTPYFHWFGKIPNLTHLRVFGCSAYAVKAADLCQKLDSTCTRMIFVGYGDRFDVKAYRLFDPEKKKFLFAHSVYFYESSLLSPQQGDETAPLLNPSSPATPQSNQEIPSSLNLVPTPQRAPPWSLGRKTNSFLFQEPSARKFPRHELATEYSQQGLPLSANSNPTSPSVDPAANSFSTEHESPTTVPPSAPLKDPTPLAQSYPDVPIKPLEQPSPLGGTKSANKQSKGPKVRSIQKIYESSNLSMLLDSSVQPIVHALGSEAAPTNFPTADAFYLQVLNATSTAPLDEGALPAVAEPVDGITMGKALAGPEASLWKQAMDSEYQSLIDNGTWELVPAPPDRKLVPGMDYSETFSPVLRITSFQAFIAIAAQFRFLLHQMDVRTAFLHGDLEEEIFMQQPPGYVSSNHPHHVCRLIKSLYGLKQSPRQWYRRFHQYMITLGYARFTSDPNIYSRHTPGMFLLLAIYVDDILLLCNSESALKIAKDELHSNFSMSDMGALHFCLGIQVVQDISKGIIKICQQSYILSLLKKYDMDACKGMVTPLPATLNVSKTDAPAAGIGNVLPFPYANILGGVGYLVTCTGPDICFAANLLFRFMQSPGNQHIQYLKRLLRYLQHTKGFGLPLMAEDLLVIDAFLAAIPAADHSLAVPSQSAPHAGNNPADESIAAQGALLSLFTPNPADEVAPAEDVIAATAVLVTRHPADKNVAAHSNPGAALVGALAADEALAAHGCTTAINVATYPVEEEVIAAEDAAAIISAFLASLQALCSTMIRQPCMRSPSQSLCACCKRGPHSCSPRPRQFSVLNTHRRHNDEGAPLVPLHGSTTANINRQVISHLSYLSKLDTLDASTNVPLPHKRPFHFLSLAHLLAGSILCAHWFPSTLAMQ